MKKLFCKKFKVLNSSYFDKYVNMLPYVCIVMYISSLMLASSSLVINIYIKFSLQYLMYFSFLLIMLKIPYCFLRGKYTVLSSCLFLVLCVLGLYCKLRNGFGELLVFYSYIISCIDIDDNRFVRISFYTMLFLLILIVTFSFIPGLNGYKHLFPRYGIERYRYGLGFNFATYAPNFLLGITFLLIYISNKYTKLLYIIVFILNIVLFAFTDTKSPFICILLILIFILFANKINDSVFNTIGKINTISFFLGALFIFLISYFFNYDNLICLKLNSLFNGRLSLAHQGFKLWGITPFGVATNMSTGANYTFVDSSYLNILFNYGYVNLIIILLIYTHVSYIAFKACDKKTIIFLFVLSLHSILDPQLIAIVYNPVIALLFLYMIKKHNYVKN